MAVEITPAQNGNMGSAVTGFTVAGATAEDYAALRQAVYRDRIIVLKDQQDITPEEFVELGRHFGTIVPYYEETYHHPDHPEIFVSSNLSADGRPLGVPRTGRFWHADYMFAQEPLSVTVFAQKILPPGRRGTYFIDMVKAFRDLPESLKQEARVTRASHSVRRFFKIRPGDVFRPLGDLIREVEKISPPAVHNTVVTHPVTGEEILYVSEGFTDHLIGAERDSLLRDLLEASGQLDETFTDPHIVLHTYEPGEIVVWDNRALVHCALHATDPSAPVMSHRVTTVDGHPFDANPTPAGRGAGTGSAK
ncbi:TauD/TfdA dioxygenase family protein [Corynebacterium provencense]|uniref:TauD/TfdA dioxygenase family protein n=1 Tax=Corynebacterium provencense TaxID=1737425 RepID=UPI000B0ACA9D|nr:TauD/TfdA family dioxygenase [Corynebacterium provencense]